MPYDEKPPKYGDLLRRQEFLDTVKAGGFIDYDGYGHPIKDGMMNGKIDVYPSLVGTGKSEPGGLPGHVWADLPEDATHIVWFNR